MPRTEVLGGAPQPHHLKKALLITTAATVGVVAVAGAAAMISESQSNRPSSQNEQQIPGELTPVETAIIERGIIIPPTEVPTVKPEPTAAATATVAARKEAVPCIITTPELCAQAERIQIVRKDIDGRTETYIAFNPDEKTASFAPEDGRLLDKGKLSGDPFSGFRATLYKPDPPGGAYVVIGLKSDNMIQVENPKKGSLMGYSDEITNFGAKVLVTITKRTPDGPVIDEEALKKLFPAAYEKPIKATYTPEGPGIPNVSISYSPNPPQ